MSELTDRATEVSKSGYKSARRGFVVFITSDKILQAVLTGAVTAVVFSLNEGIAAYFQRLLAGVVPVFVPIKMYAAIGAAIIVIGAYYIDRNTDEWREYVREKTGEAVSDDSASDEDVAGDEK